MCLDPAEQTKSCEKRILWWSRSHRLCPASQGYLGASREDADHSFCSNNRNTACLLALDNVRHVQTLLGKAWPSTDYQT